MTEVEDFLERHADEIYAACEREDADAERTWMMAIIDSLDHMVGLPDRFVRQEPPEPRTFVRNYNRMLHG